MSIKHGLVQYSKGVNTRLPTPPQVYGTDLWHVHFYHSEFRRTTWDISAGKTVGCCEESYGVTPHRHFGWMTTCRLPKNTPLPYGVSIETGA